MKYGIEVKVKEEWKRMAPTRGTPYVYETKEEAEKIADMCYPDQRRWGGQQGEEVVRVVEVQ